MARRSSTRVDDDRRPTTRLRKRSPLASDAVAARWATDDRATRAAHTPTRATTPNRHARLAASRQRRRQRPHARRSRRRRAADAQARVCVFAAVERRTQVLPVRRLLLLFFLLSLVVDATIAVISWRIVAERALVSAATDNDVVSHAPLPAHRRCGARCPPPPPPPLPRLLPAQRLVRSQRPPSPPSPPSPPP